MLDATELQVQQHPSGHADKGERDKRDGRSTIRQERAVQREAIAKGAHRHASRHRISRQAPWVEKRHACVDVRRAVGNAVPRLAAWRACLVRVPAEALTVGGERFGEHGVQNSHQLRRCEVHRIRHGVTALEPGVKKTDNIEGGWQWCQVCRIAAVCGVDNFVERRGRRGAALMGRETGLDVQPGMQLEREEQLHRPPRRVGVRQVEEDYGERVQLWDGARQKATHECDASRSELRAARADDGDELSKPFASPL
mmetsp:Transcript_26811/g.71858  ORF Transcript_26811/g.71858 Transcript_26811/m.71858 type:complete len:254 (-) Transcript_26811:2149-2910(-)